MKDQDAAAIVLATTGEPREAASIGFTAFEAVRTGRPVVVTHVIHGSAHRPGYPTLVYSYSEVEERAARLVRFIAEHLESLTGSAVPVSTDTPRGRTVARLVDLSRQAHLIVVQRHGIPVRARTAAGSVTASLAGRALAPVVSVPAGWTAPATGVRRVVLGLGDLHASTNLLESGFKLAEEHAATLHVVHALGALSGGGPSARRPVERTDPLAELDDAVRPAHRRHPRVRVATEVVDGAPEQALLRVCAYDDVLVVGRRDEAHPVYEHLGPVARGLLRSVGAPPVVVVPRPLADTSPLRTRASAAPSTARVAQ